MYKLYAKLFLADHFFDRRFASFINAYVYYPFISVMIKESKQEKTKNSQILLVQAQHMATVGNFLRKKDEKVNGDFCKKEQVFPAPCVLEVF